MTYDLRAMVREAGTSRRRSLTLRDIEPTQTLRNELYGIIVQVPQFWAAEIRETLLPLYERELDLSGLIRDDASDSLAQAIENIREGATRLALSLTPSLQSWVTRIERWHRGKWVSIVKAGTGLDIASLVTNLSAAEEIRAYQEWASSLIRDVSEEIRRKVEAQAYQAYVDRLPRRELAKQLQPALKSSKRRALTIAADQTSKVSAKMDELRQREAGISEYRWRHSGKRDYRPGHKARGGNVYAWNDPRIGTDKPGVAVWCGCTAQAYIKLMDEVGV